MLKLVLFLRISYKIPVAHTYVANFVIVLVFFLNSKVLITLVIGDKWLKQDRWLTPPNKTRAAKFFKQLQKSKRLLALMYANKISMSLWNALYKYGKQHWSI